MNRTSLACDQTPDVGANVGKEKVEFNPQKSQHAKKACLKPNSLLTPNFSVDTLKSNDAFGELMSKKTNTGIYYEHVRVTSLRVGTPCPQENYRYIVVSAGTRRKPGSRSDRTIET
jgi:hypothetical protein